MWIEGHNYKSLNFTMLEKELREKLKKQTYRTLFIPSFEIGEIIAITFKDLFKKEIKKEFLYLAEVKDLYPKQLKNITLEEAQLDGFKSILSMQRAITGLNNLKNLNHWGFIIRFEAIPTVMDYLQE